MTRLLLSLLSLLLTVAGFIAQAAGDTKAIELLAKARAAIGGEREVARVQGVSCAGTVSRAIGDRQISGEVTLDLQLPDKMLRTETISPMGDSALVITEQGINGDTVLRNMKTLNTPPGAVIRMPPPPAAGSEAEAQALRNSRAELARMTIAILLTPPSSVPVEFTYAGEAESPDGRADVLDVKSGAGFAAKLFLDKSSHRPLMLAYRGLAPRMVMHTQSAPNPQAPARADAPPPPSDVADINMYFDDYKSVDGVLLPHHISRAIDGQTNEEWTFKTIRVNPAFKPETFARK